MADSIFTSVDGLQELGEKFRELGSEIGHKIAQKAVNAGARVIAKRAIELAPVAIKNHKLYEFNVLVPAGNLKKNIVVKKVSRTELTAEAIVTVRGKRKDNFAARYGRLQEWGTVKEPAHPYLRPAFEQEKGFAVGRIKEVLKTEIEKSETAKKAK